MEFIVYEQKGQYAIITISREKALNALNSAVLEELDKVLDQVDLGTVRCLIVTGAGQKSFVAGAKRKGKRLARRAMMYSADWRIFRFP